MSATNDEVVELPDSERLSEDEMKSNIREQTAELRNLVDTYQRQHQQMQEEVAEFIVRDVEEQNSMHSIARTVLEAQRTSLSNPNYIRWANANKKGEFAEKSVEGLGETPLTSGVVGDPDIVMQAAQTADGGGVSALRTSFGKLDLLDRRVLDIIKGFRGMPAQKADVIAQVTIFVEQCLDRIRLTTLPPRHVIVPFLNGSVLWPTQAYIDGTPTPDTVTSLLGPSNSTAQHRYASWLHHMVTLYFVTPTADTPAALAKLVVGALLGCEWGGVDGSIPNPIEAAKDAVGPKMRDEGNYLVFAVLPLDSLPTTHLRVFVSRGDVVTMDVLGPALNPFDDGPSTSDQLPIEWYDTIKSQTLSFIQKHRVPSGGLAISWMINSTILPCSSNSTPIIINCSTISPDLPFNIHQSLTWTDLCGLVASAASNKSSGLVAEHEGSAPLRYVQMRVVDLTPFDALSLIWFPALNQAQEALLASTTTINATQEPVSSHTPDEKRPLDTTTACAKKTEKLVAAAAPKHQDPRTLVSPTAPPPPPATSSNTHLLIGAGFALTAVLAGAGGFVAAKRSMGGK